MEDQMPAARAYSANFSSVTEIANAALHSEEGMRITFLASELGDMEACARAARSFQKSFTALRARARVRNEKALGERAERYTSATGIYDKLACMTNKLPDLTGWYVDLLPSTHVLSRFTITDIKTGLPAAQFTAEHNEWDLLARKSQKFTLTQWEWDRLTKLDASVHPDVGTTREPWHTMDGTQWYPRPESDGSQPHAEREALPEGVEDMLDEGLDFAED
jgi:hypothetical protein